jgi:hypothetical protein
MQLGLVRDETSVPESFRMAIQTLSIFEVNNPLCWITIFEDLAPLYLGIIIGSHVRAMNILRCRSRQSVESVINWPLQLYELCCLGRQCIDIRILYEK